MRNARLRSRRRGPQDRKKPSLSPRKIPANNHQANLHQPATPERIMQMAWGYAPPLILESALNYRLFDLLEQGPRTVEELSAQTGASVRGLRAILNALVAFDFLQRKGEKYKLTLESATFLISTKPAYHGSFFRHMVRQLIPH